MAEKVLKFWNADSHRVVSETIRIFRAGGGGLRRGAVPRARLSQAECFHYVPRTMRFRRWQWALICLDSLPKCKQHVLEYGPIPLPTAMAPPAVGALRRTISLHQMQNDCQVSSAPSRNRAVAWSRWWRRFVLSTCILTNSAATMRRLNGVLQVWHGGHYNSICRMTTGVGLAWNHFDLFICRQRY